MSLVIGNKKFPLFSNLLENDSFYFRLVGFATRRYTQQQQAVPGSAIFAWQELGASVYYNNPGGTHSLLLRRPYLNMGQGVSIPFDCCHLILD